MSAPTQTDLKTLDYAFAGQPFCELGTATGLDLVFAGEPLDVIAPSSSSSGTQPVIFFAT